MRQLVLDFGITQIYRLQDFVVGNNAEVLSALHDQIQGRPYAHSIYLFGILGCGRTHLLRASTHECGDLGCYIDAQQDPDLTSLGEAYSFIAIDNLACLSEQGQIFLFDIFNKNSNMSKRLLMAGTDSPLFLPLRNDLRTRVSKCLSFMVATLSESDQVIALKNRAEARGLFIPDNVLRYMMTRVNRDMQTLCAILDSLDQLSFEQKRMITLPLVREMISVIPALDRRDAADNGEEAT